MAVRVSDVKGVGGPVDNRDTRSRQPGLPRGEVVDRKRHEVPRATRRSRSAELTLQHEDGVAGLEPHRANAAVLDLPANLAQIQQARIEGKRGLAVGDA